MPSSFTKWRRVNLSHRKKCIRDGFGFRVFLERRTVSGFGEVPRVVWELSRGLVCIVDEERVGAQQLNLERFDRDSNI